MNSITRQGITDTVWREGAACLWVRNNGEQLLVTANMHFSDEALLEAFATYLKWRRIQSQPAESEVEPGD
jgi:hypothetical protein